MITHLMQHPPLLLSHHQQTFIFHLPQQGPLESGGAFVGVTVDIDGQVRPGPAGSVNGGATAPDIGYDEFDGVPGGDITPPVIFYTALTNTSCIKQVLQM
ncbi:MAG: hypothetical protein R3A12_07065 [Ignavibacteria bacterium]